MSIAVGIDPGAHGALATYETQSRRIVDCIDIPTMKVIVNKKRREKIDAVQLYNWLEMQKICGAELVLIEAVGGRPQQSASAGFVFGYGVGLIYMACVALKLPIETVQPHTWKKYMGLPGKMKVVEKFNDKGKSKKVRVENPEADGMIVNRACELLPDARNMFYGPQGGKKVDRAEAALLAKYAGDYLIKLNRVQGVDVDWQSYEDKLDLGA